MSKGSISRRTVFGAGVCALAAAGIPRLVRASAETGGRSKSEDVVREYYAAWETKHWNPIDALLADDFTFSSPLDDHISKSSFKKGCWDTQVAFTDRFDLKQVIGSGNEAFVMYECHTMNGKVFHNVEYFKVRDDKVKSIECYFGGKMSFPSAVSSGKG
jgi:ketosteroid isomerase-like protein